MRAIRFGVFVAALMLEIAAAVGPPKVCDTLECKRLAGRMLVQMDHENTPCDNFYSYACGGLYSDPFINEYDFYKDVLDRIKGVIKRTDNTSLPVFQHFKAYYQSCTTMKNIKEFEREWAYEVLSALDDVGSFTNERRKDWNFTKLFLGLLKYDSPMAFDITLDVDEKNSSQFVVKMTVPSRASPFILQDKSLSACYEKASATKGSIVDMSELYESFKNCKKVKTEASVQSFLRSLEILNETDMFQISLSDAAAIQYHLETLYDHNSNKMPSKSMQKQNQTSRSHWLTNVKNIGKRYAGVDWDVLLSELLRRDIPKDTPVQVYSEDYFDDVFKTLNRKKKGYKYLAYLAAFIHKLFKELMMHRDDWEEYCLHVTSTMMEDVAAAAYISTFKEGELSALSRGAEHIFQQLKDILEHQLQHSEWLDSESRSLLVSKLHDIQLAVGSAEQVFSNISHLDHMMDEFPMDPEHYVKNSLKLFRRRRLLMYSVYGMNPMDPKSIWSHFLTPQSTSPVFVYGLNLIAIPFGMLANPFFSLTLPKYVVMARLGTEIARQLAHHFDGVGLKYIHKTYSGHLILKGEPKEYYQGMDNCFDHLTAYPMTRDAQDGSIAKIILDSPLSKESRLADDISTMLVYTMLQNSSLYDEPMLPFLNISNDKAFFLLLAQNFCSKQSLLSSAISLYEEEDLPPFLRVGQIASNSEGFMRTFDCPPGSKLIPALRCEVFPILTIETHMNFAPLDFSLE
ncbi:endothelin-converting enzyme 2 [Anabrus simplex]|uniref:endothelin-converting enzyme 2 n=1 Tax=Anabrus simplex TaxID=316456 RepID=UPI0035A35685